MLEFILLYEILYTTRQEKEVLSLVIPAFVTERMTIDNKNLC